MPSKLHVNHKLSLLLLPSPPTPIPMDVEARPLSVSVQAGGSVEAQLEVRIKAQTVTLLDCTFTGEAAPWITLQATLPMTYTLNFTKPSIEISLPVRVQPPQDANPGSYTADARISCLLPNGGGVAVGTYIAVTVTPRPLETPLGDVRLVILMIIITGYLAYYGVRR